MGMGATPSIRAVARLARPKVSLAVGLCAAGGAVLFAALHGLEVSRMMPRMVAVSVGAFLLCAGCSGLNQVQERKTDALMRRTQGRPLPSAGLSVLQGLVWSVIWILAGMQLFFWAEGWRLLRVGLFIPLVYNGLYTPLKRRTPMAILVGGLAGAMPPLTGWMAAGGAMTAPVILGCCAMLYLWQVPHFWLLSESHADDYKRAGFPIAKDSFPPWLYRTLLALWTGAYFAALALAAGMAGLELSGLAALTVAPAAAVLMMTGRRKVAFATVNATMFLAVLAAFGLVV